MGPKTGASGYLCTIVVPTPIVPVTTDHQGLTTVKFPILVLVFTGLCSEQGHRETVRHRSEALFLGAQ